MLKLCDNTIWKPLHMIHTSCLKKLSFSINMEIGQPFLYPQKKKVSNLQIITNLWQNI